MKHSHEKSSIKILIISGLLLAAGLLSFRSDIMQDYIRHDIRIERHKAVKMSDGVTLYADVYLPAEEGKYPTIVSSTPYGVQRDGAHEMFVRFAQHGYAVVFFDVRGRYESEGRWEPFRNEAKDGYESIEWAAAQPFSNGKVATYGGSYVGHNQWAAASRLLLTL